VALLPLIAAPAAGEAPDALAAAIGRLSSALEDAVALVEAHPWAGSDQERAEGARRVLRQLVRGLVFELGSEDPTLPSFFRATDRFLKAGLDNPDNHYLWARIEPGAVYRVTGTRGTTADFVLQVYSAMPGLPDWPGRYRTGGMLDAKTLVTGPDGRFEVLLGGAERAVNWLPLEPDARVLMVRYTFSDWSEEEAGSIEIERVGERGRPSRPLTSPNLVARIDQAAFFLLDGTRRYLEVTRGIVARSPANTLPQLYLSTDGGVRTQVSTAGHFELGPDEALIVTTRPSDAAYQGFQLGNLWFESLEYGDRLTSYTTAQARLSSDGVYRFVISARDPGVHNWLDTTGHHRGLMLLRWQGGGMLTEDHQPEVEKVGLADVRGRFPADEPEMSAAERRAQLAARQQEILARFPW
jgi:hypothetical protein